MAEQSITDKSPGSILFPEYETLYDLIASEVQGLSDQELDFTSDRWEWSAWSIRRQLSHMASLIYRWLLLRWGDALFPDGGHGVRDVQGIAQSDFDRRMDENQYWDLPVIMEQLLGGINLARRVLADREVGFLRSHTYHMDMSPQWDLMLKAHSTGFTVSGEPNKEAMTLEASIRHIYFEEITHLYNIQRLKRAQGLTAAVDLPRVGYWAVDGWDRSEP
jgi:hypothetical protein